jgi:hypothetical protein
LASADAARTTVEKAVSSLKTELSHVTHALRQRTQEVETTRARLAAAVEGRLTVFSNHNNAVTGDGDGDGGNDDSDSISLNVSVSGVSTSGNGSGIGSGNGNCVSITDSERVVAAVKDAAARELSLLKQRLATAEVGYFALKHNYTPTQAHLHTHTNTLTTVFAEATARNGYCCVLYLIIVL